MKRTDTGVFCMPIIETEVSQSTGHSVTRFQSVCLSVLYVRCLEHFFRKTFYICFNSNLIYLIQNKVDKNIGRFREKILFFM